MNVSMPPLCAKKKKKKLQLAGCVCSAHVKKQNKMQEPREEAGRGARGSRPPALPRASVRLLSARRVPVHFPVYFNGIFNSFQEIISGTRMFMRVTDLQ